MLDTQIEYSTPGQIFKIWHPRQPYLASTSTNHCSQAHRHTRYSVHHPCIHLTSPHCVFTILNSMSPVLREQLDSTVLQAGLIIKKNFSSESATSISQSANQPISQQASQPTQFLLSNNDLLM